MKKSVIVIGALCVLTVVGIIVGIGGYIVFTGAKRFKRTYYPLKADMTWVYQVSGGIFGPGKEVETNFPSRELKGKKVVPRKSEKGLESSFTFIGEDRDGIYIFARQPPSAMEPIILQPPAYLIRYPIQVSTTWEVSMPKGKNDTLTLQVAIESISETVTVPAGTFERCLKVKSVGSATDGGSIEVYDWYAPGVGLIKSISKFTDVFWGVKASGKTAKELEAFMTH